MVAERNGAQMLFSNGMREWDARSEAVRVTLDDGSIVEAERLIVATGPWIAPLFATLAIPIHVQRNVQVWFEPSTSCYEASAFPTFLVDRADEPALLYGFPDFGDGVKAAFHGFGAITSADTLPRAIDEAIDVKPLALALERWMPGASNRYLDAKACMYSLTPDGNFVIDIHPEYSNVVICGGFSGHGFKFAPVIGEIATQLSLGETPSYDLRFLSATRFSQ